MLGHPNDHEEVLSSESSFGIQFEKTSLMRMLMLMLQNIFQPAGTSLGNSVSHENINHEETTSEKKRKVEPCSRAK